jgi:hypothetical protein
VTNNCSKAEASAQASSSAYTQAWASAKAAAISQAEAVADSCGYENAVDPYIQTGQQSLPNAYCATSQDKTAMVSSEGTRYKAALAYVDETNSAVAVAELQCAACANGKEW